MAGVAGLGVALLPLAAKAAAARAAAAPRRVAELPEGPALIGRVSCELNETARFIYDHCDGAQGTDDIARLVAREYDVTVEQAHLDVVTCVAALRDMGLVQ